MAQTSYGTITITDTTDIAEIENWYLASNKGSGVTISESGWTKDVTNTNAVMTANKQYLWNYEKILGTGDVVINTTSPVIIGRYGQNGGTGAAGKGISSIVEYYNTTTTAVKPTDTSGFTTEVKQVDSTNKYLWNYEVINYTEGNPTTTDIRLIGVYGDPGNDAYTVILDNDSHTFSAGTSAATATNITVKVIAYKGTTQVAATIGTISGQVTGLTTSLVNNSSVNAGFKITVTTSLTAKSGVLTIPITVDGKSFTRKFSWSLALTGQTGTSVSSTIKYYKLATSKPNQPSNNAAIPSGWGADEPTFDSSKLAYTLYTVIQTTYSNGNIIYSAVQVDSAFEAAKVAYQKAQTAQTNASNAITTARGKNTIYYQASKPTGGIYKAGDTWFDTDNGNAIYTWDNDLSDWVSAQLGENAIANLAITNAKIANLDGAKIVANSIDANSLNVDSINTSNKITIGAFETASQEDILNKTISDEIDSKFEQIDTSLGQVNDLIDEHSSAIQTLNGQMETIMAPIELDASSDNPFIKIQAINKDSPTSQEFAYLLLTKDRISFFKVTDADNDLSTQEDQIKNEVLYIDSTESQGVIDINNARVHQSIRIGQLEIFQYNGGIAVRRTR